MIGPKRFSRLRDFRPRACILIAAATAFLFSVGSFWKGGTGDRLLEHFSGAWETWLLVGSFFLRSPAAPPASGRARRLAGWLGWVVLALGVTVLAGWALEVDALKTVLPGLVTMKANTALGLALCGAALVLLARPPSGIARAGVVALAAVVIALGTLTLAQYFGGWNLHLDEALFHDPFLNKISTSSPGRMAPISALSFVFLGFGLWLGVWPSAARWRFPLLTALAAAVGVIGMVAFLGCLLKLATGSVWWDYTGLAVHTAAGFALLGLGLLAWCQSEGGLHWSLDGWATGGFAVAVALMVTMAGASFGFTSKLREWDAWVSHTQQVLKEIQDVATDVMQMQAEQRGYLLLGDPKLLERYTRAKESVWKNLTEVHGITADNELQQRRVDQLQPIIAQRVAWSDENIATYQRGGLAAVQQRMLTGNGIALTDQIIALIQTMEAEEQRLLRERETQSGPLATTALLLLPLGVFFSLTLLFLGMALLNADVLARQQAEVEHQRLAQLIEHSRDFIATADLDGRITFINRGARQMIGMPEEQEAGTLHFTDYVPPDWQQFFQEEVIATAREKGLWEGEMQLRHLQTGALLEVSRSTFLLRDAAGQPHSFATVTRDITGAKRAEAALHASEERLRLAITGAGLGTWHWDMRAGTIDFSERCLEIFGIPQGAAMSYARFRESLHPDDRERTDETVRQALASGSEYSIEYRALWPDGSEHWIAARGSGYYNAQGEPVRMQGVVIEITERKRVEEALRASETGLAAAQALAHLGSWELDLGTMEGVWSAEMSRLLGRAPALPAPGFAEFLEMIHPEDRENILDAQAQTPDATAPLTIEYRTDPTRGPVRHLQATIHVLRDAAGRAVRSVGTTLDVTERRAAELALRERDAQLHATDRRLADIIQGMTEACFALDQDWCFTFVNDRGETLLHQRREEMLGRTIWEVFHQLVGTPMEGHYRRAMAQRVPVVFEVFSPIAERWLDIRLFPTGEGLAAFLLDIQTRKMAELELEQSRAEFKDLFDHAPAGYHEVDATGRIARVNETELKMLGYSADELLGKYVWKISSEEEVSRRAVGEKLRGSVPLQAFERQLKRKDGSSFPVLIEDRLVRGPNGEVAGIRSVIKDITERKLAEEALRESEDRFRTMANSMSQLAWIAQADGFIFWYNQRWYEYTGTTPEEMEGWGWQNVHDPEVLPRVLASWQEAIAAGKPFEMEFPLRGADGRFRRFLTRAQPLRNSQGGVAQWFGTNTDVDALKQMEDSLRTTQVRLNSTLSAGSIGTWTWDLANDRLVSDEFTARTFCLAAEAAAQGLPAAAYLQAVLEEDQPAVSAGLARAIETCGNYDLEYRVRQKDGTLLWLQARGRVEGDAAGRARHFHGAVMDITARKLAEAAVRTSEEHFRFLDNLSEATRTLVDPAQIMAVMARMLGEHLQASRCAYADVEQDGERFTILHDYTDGCRSTVGDYALSLFGPRAVATLHGGQTLIIRRVDTELLPGEGADMFKAIGIQAIITCPLVKKGMLRAMMAVHQTAPRDWKPEEIAIVQDVVERCWATLERRTVEEKIHQLNATLEQRVVERTAQLEAANRELEAFSYSVSHDLRAPLRAVDGFSRAVVEDYGPLLPEEGQRFLQTIRNGAQRMGVLIDDLLTFSRLSRLPLHKRSIDTARMVQESLADLQNQREGREIEIKIGDLPACAGDPALLKQVWINLLSNACKYTQRRALAKIEIGSSCAAGEIVYFVRDNGAGFDMRYAGKLFGVFQRLHRAEDYEGTGVGLAIVQRVIHRHGGRVWAEAEEDRGANFYFTLPSET